MCNEKVITALKFVQRQFLCGVPVNNISWSNIFCDNFSWDNQQILINLTVGHDLVAKRPLKISYQVSFLKFLIRRLEEQGSEANDCVYDALGRLVALPAPDACYKHYSIEGGKVISLKENPSIISEGTTGLCSWQASLALSEWCLTNKIVLAGKSILELGSGVGLTGLSVALNCNPKKIYLTDCHESVLKVLCENVARNVIGEEIDPSIREDVSVQNLLRKTISKRTTIEVLNLPWEDITEIICEYTRPDLLLAADVIYDSSLFPTLINAVSCLLGWPNTKELIIACTVRNEQTLEEFLGLLVIHDLIYRELEPVQPNNFIWSTECSIRIFSVTKPAS